MIPGQGVHTIFDNIFLAVAIDRVARASAAMCRVKSKARMSLRPPGLRVLKSRIERRARADKAIFALFGFNESSGPIGGI
jgi:hypothetical protein